MVLNDNFSAFLSHTVCQLSMYKLLLSSTALTHLGVQCTRRRGSATTSFRTASISDRRTARNSRSALVSAFTMRSFRPILLLNFQMLPTEEEMQLPNSRQPLPNQRSKFVTKWPPCLLHSFNQPTSSTKLKIRRVSIQNLG